MPTPQRIVPSRRAYNRWVADETLEDYALRFTAASARRWSMGAVANTALGATAFLALEAIGAAITLRYGFANAVAAILVVSIVIFATALPIALAATRRGLDIDLLTRSAGFGYIGSTVTSLIYASFTFIFFALEASILAAALDVCLGIPPRIGYAASAAVVIPMVTYGIAFIGPFQRWTQPFWLVLNLLPFCLIAARGNADLAGWAGFRGASDGFAMLPFGCAASVVMALVAQVGEQVDFLRFLPPTTTGKGWRWWLSLLCAGPGWIVPGALKMLAGSFLAVLAIKAGTAPGNAVQPIALYRLAFTQALGDPRWALVLGLSLVVVAQIKINVTNAYAGSIAWSNFFSRLTHNHPGRVVWVVFNVAIALLLMEVGIFDAVEAILALYAVIASGWVGALVSDLVLVRPLGLAPKETDFKRAHLYDINPVGVGAMLVAVALGLLGHFGLLGALAQAYAPFLALAAAFMVAPLLAWATRGQYYLARKPRRDWVEGATPACVVCGNGFEPQDTAYCPVYGGAICSLCCSLDARCGDACKPDARLGAQLRKVVQATIPHSLRPHLDGLLARFLLVFVLAAGVIGLILLAIYVQAARSHAAEGWLLANAMWRAYFVLVVIAGVAAWLLVLTQEARSSALEEMRRQASLLFDEIAAHGRTDAALQKAKEVAEAANLAKSRFIVGITHELRTPLNVVLGYAQLLEMDPRIPPHRHEAVNIIRRSGEHLSGLIEGLLDISKIEAGRIQIERREIRFGEFLEQICDMFRQQAAAKGIGFNLEWIGPNLVSVFADETRLRQILINLLSNAVKFTVRGGVTLRVQTRGEVTDITVEDTGVGIDPADAERIFEPFERGGGTQAQAGIGLGLTITRLLVQILGGDLTMRSRRGEGTCFRVRLLLPQVARPTPALPAGPRIQNYRGKRRILLVVDDDAAHRTLLRDVLVPLGFTALLAPDGASCLRLAQECQPDAFLLDLSMPELDGWTLARRLRELGHAAPIIVVSAHPDDTRLRHGEVMLRDAFLSKPLNLQLLLQTLGQLLHLDWVEEAPKPALPARVPDGLLGELAELSRLVSIGHMRAVRDRLDAMEAAHPAAASFVGRLRVAATGFRLDELAALIRTKSDLPKEDGD